MNWKRNRLTICFCGIYGVMLIADWCARGIPFHFGCHAAHFYMSDQVCSKTHYYRANAVYDQTIYGYLSHLLGIESRRHYHRQRMTTNEEGLRMAAHPLPEKPHGLAVTGDSFVFGSYNSDRDALSEALHRRLNLPVRNFAFPGDPVIHMLALLHREDVFPSVIIWGLTERAITKEAFNAVDAFEKNGFSRRGDEVKNTRGFSCFKELFEAHRKDSFIKHLSNAAWANIKYYILRDISKDLWTPIHPKMLFYREGVEKMGRMADPDELEYITNNVEKIVRKADEKGAEVIILLIPDKCTVYTEYVLDPEKQENLKLNRFLHHVEKAIKSKQLRVINLMDAYYERRDEGLFYYPDDTHWNARGIAVAAETAAGYLESNGFLEKWK